MENLYENCNENANHIETEILAKDYEDNMKKDLEDIINKDTKFFRNLRNFWNFFVSLII